MQGGTGGPGAQGSQGPAGPTGAPGPAPTGITGGPGGSGDLGLVGPQGPSGAQGPTGATGAVSVGVVTSNGSTALPAGPGELGNTLTVGGQSLIAVTCPVGTNIRGGGAELLPHDDNVRGILESSFPDPSATNATQRWLITAEVTATGPASDLANDLLAVVPWVSCGTPN